MTLKRERHYGYSVAIERDVGGRDDSPLRWDAGGMLRFCAVVGLR